VGPGCLPPSDSNCNQGSSTKINVLCMCVASHALEHPFTMAEAWCKTHDPHLLGYRCRLLMHC
jgi:hypothetical protein